ncbi:DUF4214 domain-containing protein [Dechloromonas sp. ZY10]|uniref:DUF4214 domain-containing protein n=1 Tax=Dechloromonas aquae TaxID=2664436 RepID=UPI003529701C
MQNQNFDDFKVSNVQVAATGPTVSGVAITSATGIQNSTLNAGDVVSATVTMSAATTVNTGGGTPYLDLNIGGTTVQAAYASGSGSTSLVFQYTIQAGQTDANGISIGASGIHTNGGTFKDGSANDATLTFLAVSDNASYKVDTAAPTVSGVTASTANGSYKVGDTVSIQVNFSENVTVIGTPQLTLETGTTDRTINYVSGSGGSSLTFTYTVQAGDNTSDLDFTSTSALALNGGTIKDTAGNNATLTLASPGAANSLGANKAIVIDGIVPTVSGVTSSTANGTYKVGDTVSIQVNFSENVTVIGTPQLTLETGTTDRTINYVSGSGGSSLTFTYTVQAGDTSSDLDFASSSALALNSGTIKDAAGNDATLTLATPGAANSLGNNKALVIDGVVPTVTAVSSSTSNGTYTTGDVIAITVTFSEVVNVTGTPQLTLETGSTDRTIDYASGTGTNTLTFNYTVQNGDTSADLDYVATSSLALNGGTIKDAAGNDATLTLASPGAANSLGNNKAIVISTTKELISATYDASTGVLSVTGANMGTGATVDVSKLSLTGQGGASYTLTTGNVTTSSGTAFSVTLNATDKLNINGLLNKNGTSSVGATTYNLAGAADWISGAAADTTGNGVTVSNVQTPTITSATYDASTGALVVTGTNLVKASGATNDITVSKLKLTGEGGSGAAYLLTTSDVEVTSATSFSVTLNATDKAAVNQILNKNGTSSTGSTTYNLEAADDWNTVIGNTDIADATNAVTVSNVAAPTITSATYNASTGALVVTGTGFLKLTGATNDIVANKFTLTGEGGSTYTLTDTANVEITSGTAFTLTLSATDKAAVNLIVNKDGASSTDNTTYNLAAAEDWTAGADSAVVVADLTGNGVTASNVAVPTITSATYDAATGALVVTGTGFLKKSGATNDIVANKLTISGDSSAYTLTDTANVEITSATSFTVNLSATDKTAVASRINKDGTTSNGSATYNLAAAEGWAAGSAATHADLTLNGITASNAGVSLVSATYDANTGILAVTGANMGTGDTIDVNKLTLAGEGGATHALTTSSVTTSSGTAFSVTLNATDKAAVNQILNQAGTSSTGGTTFNLAGAANWNSTVSAPADLTGNVVTVSNPTTPTITSATYDAAAGTLVVTGTGFLKLNGATNDIVANKFKLTGEASYTLTDTANVEITSGTAFTLTLSATDKAAVNQILNKNGTSSTSNTTYNLEAAEDWAAGAAAAVVVADTTGNGITVSNVAVPTITSATYNASTGALVVTGTGLLQKSGATNDIVANKFTLTGEGGSTYTLTDTANVEITSGTAFTLTLSATDKAAVNQIVNKDGTTSTGGTTFNLAAAEDWVAGADSAVVVADLTGNGVTASNVAAPTLTSATYDEASGVLVVTGTGFLKKSGAANDIVANKLTIKGDSTDYTLTDTANVEITNASSFTVNLSSTDKTQLATRLNKAGTSSTGNVTYNLAGAEDWAAGADAAVNVADLTGNGITVTLTPPSSGGGGGGATTTPSSDGDSIPDSVEDEAPALSGNNGNGGGSGSNPGVKGDGNGDGIADSKQANVTSLQFEKNDQAVSNPNNVKTFVTLEVNDANTTGGSTQSTATLTSVKQQDAPKEKPADLSMPMGLIDFTAKASSTGASDTFKLFVDSTIKANGYWKQNVKKEWVNLASGDYGGKVVTENGKTRFEFKIKDGGEFDNDGKADGVITDPGAIGFRELSSANDSDRDQFPDTLEAANGLKVGTKDNDVFGSSKFFVMQLYRDILFREAEEGGLKYWQNLIDSGARSKTLVASNFLESPEFQAGAGAVARLYFGALNRLPDDAGMDSWMTQVLSGTPVAAIASNFVASSEFTSRFDTQSLESFVDRMYQNVMSRSADANGKAYWVQKLNAGASKGEVVLGFTESPEYKAATAAKVGMTLNYVGLLGRSPEQSGMDFWLAKQAAGTPQIEIIGSFMGTQEYHDRFLP